MVLNLTQRLHMASYALVFEYLAEDFDNFPTWEKRPKTPFLFKIEEKIQEHGIE